MTTWKQLKDRLPDDVGFTIESKAYNVATGRILSDTARSIDFDSFDFDECDLDIFREHSLVDQLALYYKESLENI